MRHAGEFFRRHDGRGCRLNNVIAMVASALLLALGLMAGAALFFVFLFVVAGFWLVFQVRRIWARLTGKPVGAWTAGRFDPRNGFQYGYQSMNRYARARAQQQRIQADVTDVEPRAPQSGASEAKE